MGTVQQTTAVKETPKKGFVGKFLSFLMYGGFLVVIVFGLAVVILLDLYVF